MVDLEHVQLYPEWVGVAAQVEPLRAPRTLNGLTSNRGLSREIQIEKCGAHQATKGTIVARTHRLIGNKLL